ncbi:NAD(P)H-quinone oxidoreductase subunit 5 [Solimonas aquatica]|uniref:Probable inorganic carbon transporter subunit DabB n=1 Tax=Solimonas aquatica TaxID=489703 RepID=A0A1H9LBH9_9GAMM|nr:NADH-quinone oxidoreductase subunit L [Solimonas aquatica]SER08343.1 NAD(P)H-quinone oxidoreductase subunit 5 [Solimonas aquatica]
MSVWSALVWVLALMPVLLMLLPALAARARHATPGPVWSRFVVCSVLAGASALSTLLLALFAPAAGALPGLEASVLGASLALLVQLLGTVIGVFSSRYLQGEARQPAYVAAFAGTLAGVQLLLLANHWLLLILSWAVLGQTLQRLLCFYPERPFALLAAHKKFIADRLADVLLLLAMVLAWWQVGSGSFSALWAQLQASGASTALQLSAVCLVLAVILRTALLPVHGWLIQVMEAPTPVSALLHAGVVNLGGFVLIRFAPLLEAAPVARGLLLVFGLLTALLAGLVTLTRISIKVRLAWSTVAQMGFMLLECGLGLYTLAALHLIGHSLYKAHSFLGASGVVRQTRLRELRGSAAPLGWSLLLAPLCSLLVVTLLPQALGESVWPWWWCGILALAWAPLFWQAPRTPPQAPSHLRRALSGLGMVALLTALAWLAHRLPLGLQDQPETAFGIVALIGMGLMYVGLALIEWRPHWLETWRRWSYAGFYVDEFYTRLALQLWPKPWAGAAAWAQTPKLQAAASAPGAE